MTRSDYDVGMSGWGRAEDNSIAREEGKELKVQGIGKMMYKNPEITKH